MQKQKLNNKEFPLFPVEVEDAHVVVFSLSGKYKDTSRQTYGALYSFDNIYQLKKNNKKLIYFNNTVTHALTTFEQSPQWSFAELVSDGTEGWSTIQEIKASGESTDIEIGSVIWTSRTILDYNTKQIAKQTQNPILIENGADTPGVYGNIADQFVPINKQAEAFSVYPNIFIQNKGTITYEWYREGYGLVSRENVFIPLSEFNAQSPVEKGDTYSYYCVIVNQYNNSYTCSPSISATIEVGEITEIGTPQVAERILGMYVGQYIRRMMEATFSRPLVNLALGAYKNGSQIIENLGVAPVNGLIWTNQGQSEASLEYGLGIDDKSGLVLANGAYGIVELNGALTKEEEVQPFTWLIEIPRCRENGAGSAVLCKTNDQEDGKPGLKILYNSDSQSLGIAYKKYPYGIYFNGSPDDNTQELIVPGNSTFTLAIVYGEYNEKEKKQEVKFYYNGNLIYRASKSDALLTSLDRLYLGSDDSNDKIETLKFSKFIVYDKALNEYEVNKALRGTYQ